MRGANEPGIGRCLRNLMDPPVEAAQKLLQSSKLPLSEFALPMRGNLANGCAWTLRCSRAPGKRDTKPRP